MIQGYILGFLICISGAYFLARILKTSIPKTLPFYLLGFPLIVYIFAMLNQLLLGYVLVIAASVIPTIYILIKNRKNLTNELKPLRSPNFILICAVFLLLGIINFGRSFHAWDDYMHWGPFAKETYRNLELYNSENSLVEVHKDYPPIITLYEVFWEIVAGKFDDSLLFIALQFLGISLLLPFVNEIKWQKSKKFKLKFAGLALALVLIPASFSLGDDYFFVTIMTDTVIGLLFAFSLANIFLTKQIDEKLIAKLIIIFSFLILVKQIALVFIAIAIVCLIAKLIIEKQQKKLLLAALSIASIAVPLVLSAIWAVRVKNLGIEGQFKISELFAGIIQLIKCQGLEKWQMKTGENFIKAYIYNKDIVLGLSYFKLTLISIVGIIIAAIKKKAKRKIILSEGIILTLFSIAYAALMMLLYIFCFGPVEGPALASFERYLGTFWYAIAMLGFCFFLFKTKEFAKLPNLGLFALVFFLTIPNSASIGLTILRNFDAKNYTDATSLIKKNVKPGEKVYVISQGSNGTNNVRLKYLLNPIETNPTYESAFSFGPEDDSDIWTRTYTPEELKEALAGYDYVYLYDVDGYFANTYYKLFNSSINAGQLYKITDDKYKLVGTGR